MNMPIFVYASVLYDRMVESGISVNRNAAYQCILNKKRQGQFIYPKEKQNTRMKLKPEWIDEIIFNLFDPQGKGTWSLYEH